MQSKILATACVLLLAGLSSAQDDVNKKTTPPPTTTPTTPTTTTPTTTIAPTTAPPAPTTPTPKPTPAPKFPANEGKWSVEDDKNSTCIMIKGAIEIVFKSVENKTVNVDVPMTAVPSGNCPSALITLKWNVSSGLESWITFAFEKNESIPKFSQKDKLLLGEISAGKYALQNVSGNVYIDALNITEEFSILMASAFQTPLNHSYSCLVQEELKNENVTLKLSDVRLEAFMERTPGHREFSAAIDCPADDSGDVVPIAVGAALAGLVVIVLIAYLIGRRRSRARGYQSV